MASTPDHPKPTLLTREAEPMQRHVVGLEPSHAWRLRGLRGAEDEIIVPGILLDDVGRITSVEASMDYPVFCQLQAMAALADLRMLAARGAARPGRREPEANVWLVEGSQDGRRLAIAAIVSLDRLVFAPDRHLCVDTMTAAQIVPGEKAWR